MTVLIMKANEGIIKGMHPTVKFQESSKHTSTFQITIKKFEKLLASVRTAGYNPYALMTW